MSGRPFREAHIDLDAIAHNVEMLRRTVDTPLMTVVKSRGYGHGAVEVARVALDSGADRLGVVSIEEALDLRTAGIVAPVLCWLHDPDASFDRAISADVDLGVSYLDQLDRIAASDGVATVHLKVDSGLGRNGAAEGDWAGFFAAAAAHESAGRIRVVGLWSHLGNTGEREDLEQLHQFDLAIALAREAGLEPELLHIAATAAALRIPASRHTLVRVGLATYGLSPFDDATSADLGLRPALTLSASIASVKRVSAGHGVSYGYDYRTPGETSLALVPLGYADGIPRAASDRGPVSINGRTYRVAGRIAMDQFVVDVGDDEVRVGDRATLIGDPLAGFPSATDWADAAGTINYELVTRLGGRIERTYAS